MDREKTEQWKQFIQDTHDAEDDFDYIKQTLIYGSKFLQDVAELAKKSRDEDMERSRLVVAQEKNRQNVAALEMSKKRKTMTIEDITENDNEDITENDNESGELKTGKTSEAIDNELESTKNQLEEYKKKYEDAMAKKNVVSTQQLCLREGCGATITSKNPKSLYCSKNKLCINEKKSQNRIQRASKS